jgi:hypothetical protein
MVNISARRRCCTRSATVKNDAGSLRLLSQGRLFRRVPEVPLNPMTGDA